MHRWVAELFPICRSITGNGVRETLQQIGKRISLTVHEVPSGTQVFDWKVPLEWNIRDAYIKNLRGERLVDFQKSNLHVVSYSQPVKQRMALSELKEHLHSLPDRPDWIPYRTSYYKESWGFCLSHNQLLALTEREYDVCIDASMTEGSLTYGECLLPGQSQEEVLISTHTCHPSLGNDNLSGIAVATFLAEWLQTRPCRYSYRFLFIPGTIGSITWLSQHQKDAPRIKHGLVLTGVGDAGPVTYKKSRRGDADIDRALAHLLKHSGAPYSISDFIPYGYDERQYCSPGFNLAVGCLSRTPHSQYPEYHTSADNLEFLQPQALAESLGLCQSAIEILEGNRTYLNQNPHCEPQLGKRGLYRAIGGQAGEKSMEMAMLWVLNLSDGCHTLLDIAERSQLPFAAVARAASDLIAHALLEPVPERSPAYE
ncbi:MAG: Putative polysaccharide biosynthesis protein with aminopeptidase-like domain [Nitrospira sp.]|nr:MAG: Putative polysaccharide biosynthesis protein with aminopeptidase-like domain [Nitrospira sp.]